MTEDGWCKYCGKKVMMDAKKRLIRAIDKDKIMFFTVGKAVHIVFNNHRAAGEFCRTLNEVGDYNYDGKKVY